MTDRDTLDESPAPLGVRNHHDRGSAPLGLQAPADPSHEHPL